MVATPLTDFTVARQGQSQTQSQSQSQPQLQSLGTTEPSLRPDPFDLPVENIVEVIRTAEEHIRDAKSALRREQRGADFLREVVNSLEARVEEQILSHREEIDDTQRQYESRLCLQNAKHEKEIRHWQVKYVQLNEKWLREIGRVKQVINDIPDSQVYTAPDMRERAAEGTGVALGAATVAGDGRPSGDGRPTRTF